MYVCYFSTLWPCWNRMNDVWLFVRDLLECRKLVFLGGLSLYFQRRRNINQVLLAINCLFSNFYVFSSFSSHVRLSWQFSLTWQLRSFGYRTDTVSEPHVNRTISELISESWRLLSMSNSHRTCLRAVYVLSTAAQNRTFVVRVPHDFHQILHADRP